MRLIDQDSNELYYDITKPDTSFRTTRKYLNTLEKIIGCTYLCIADTTERSINITALTTTSL